MNHEDARFADIQPPLISMRTPDGILLLMLGIQARIIPWTITNSIGVDAKREFLI